MSDSRLKSRKFWMALLGALLPVVASYLTGEVDLEAATKASSAVLCTYLLGQGAQDAVKEHAKGKADAPDETDETDETD